MGGSGYCWSPVFFLLGLASIGQASGLCEYWGKNVDCDYDGDYKKPERCKGLGRRYCDRAPEAKECPPACLPQNCENNWKTTYKFHENDFEFAWEDLVLAGDYDFVFTLGDQVCVQTCWKDPWKMKCEKSRTYDGVKYCTSISCEHDDKNRIVGCHKMFPWHKPTCAECAKLFPEACGESLSPYVYDKYLLIDGEWKAVDAMKPNPSYLDLSNYDDPSDKASQGEEEEDEDDDRDDSETSSAGGPPAVTWTAPANSGIVFSNSDDNSDDSSGSDSNSNSDDNSGSSKPDDTSSGGNSWLQELFKNWCSDDAECPLKINGGDSPMEVANSLNIVPIVWEDGVQTISFNEISFQLEGPAEEVQSDIVAEAVSDLAGVAASQVQVVGIEPQLNLLRGWNGTLTAGMNIAMVTAVIWSSDPYAVDDQLQMLEESGELFDAVVESGIPNYLDYSMSLNVISAPLEKVLEVYPDAAIYADQADYSDEPTAGSAFGLGIGAIVGIIAGAGVLLLLVIVGILVLIKRKASSGAPQGGKAEVEFGPAKPPVVSPQETEGCL